MLAHPPLLIQRMLLQLLKSIHPFYKLKPKL